MTHAWHARLCHSNPVTLWVAAVCNMTLGLVNYVVAMYRSNIGTSSSNWSSMSEWNELRKRKGTALKHIHSNA